MNRRNMWLAIVPIILFAILALYIQAGLSSGFENWIYDEAVGKMPPAETVILKAITHAGDASVVIAFCLVLIIIPKSRNTIALPVSVAVILSQLLNFVLKNIFVRERPDILRLINETSYSFPSGHAMINAALYTMLIMLIFKYIKNYPLKTALFVFCITLTMAIGFSRVYLGVHYAGDVLGGWMIGFAISVIVYFTWKKRLLSKERENFGT